VTRRAGTEVLVEQMPSRDDVRTVLAAAADVVFSDGVSETFLEQWTDETLFLLGVRAGRSVPSSTSTGR
jgi:hypothetical protein